jgi:lipopolysaccharide/colanic/teichoic acid biosynthesis glycosyltransferase
VQPPKLAAARRSIWNRIRLQLGMGLLLAVLVPYFVRLYLEYPSVELENLNYSLAGSTIAVIAGYVGFRKMSFYPGARAGFNILPSFALSYALVMAVFFIARIDYSRLHFIASFVTAAAWYYLVYFKLQRRRMTVGVLPFGSVQALYEIPALECVTLDSVDHDLSGLDAVVADLRSDIPDEWERFLADRALDEVLVMHAKQVVESLTGRVEIEHLSENTFGSLIPGIVYAKVKRVWDLLAALLALPFIALLLLPVAILIKLDSPGPVFFRQERMGYRGRPFTMIKLRTMRSNAGPQDVRAAAMTRHNDDRVTRFGRFLRNYRIDELPQIINIIKGEMSWIGPRPEAVPLSLWYEAELPFYRYRHIVRPGITGWAQVKQGHVAEVDEVLAKLHYDFFYIRNFSFWLDILIVASTIRTILSGFGAR